MFFYSFIKVLYVVLIIYILKSNAERKISKYNVVVVVFDDLRPAIGKYGDRLAQTPHIDAFMNCSYYFSRAYSQVKFKLLFSNKRF